MVYAGNKYDDNESNGTDFQKEDDSGRILGAADIDGLADSQRQADIQKL
jgi:hypothetical protein